MSCCRANDWAWTDLIVGWVYDPALAVDVNHNTTTVRGRVLQPAVRAVNLGLPTLDWNVNLAELKPANVVGSKKRKVSDGVDSLPEGCSKQDQTRSRMFWKMTWQDVRVNGDRFSYWMQRANELDVRQLQRYADGSFVVKFDWTWQRWSDTEESLIDSFEAGRPPRQPRGRRPKRAKSEVKRTCRWCSAEVPKSQLSDHVTNTHPETCDIDAIRLRHAEQEDEEIENDMVALAFLRRCDRWRQLELDAGFSMAMARKVFVDRFVVEGTTVEQTNTAGSDTMTVTVPTPRILDAVLGDAWWWRRHPDPNGHQALSFVMFGPRMVKTPELDAAGDHVFRRKVDAVTFLHRVTSYTYHKRVFKESKLHVTFRRTRGSLLPAVAVPEA